MATPKYTFLLPAFKGKYLDEMLRSIKAQTYTDFKVLISDDCSPEDLRSICEPYLSDPRFTFRRNEQNMGSKSLVSHWNLLVDMCDTEYLIMASDDDVYEPQFLAEIDALTQKYPHVDLFRGRVTNINENGETLEEDSIFPEYQDKVTFLYNKYTSRFTLCLACFVFKSETLKKEGAFIEFPLACFSDDVTTCNLLQNGIASPYNILFRFRTSTLNLSSINNSNTGKMKIDATINFYEWFKLYKKEIEIEKNPQKKRMYATVISGIHGHIMWHLMSHVKYLNVFQKVKVILWLYQSELLSKYTDKFLLALRIFKA